MNAVQTLAPLSVATAETALAAYEIALTTRTPAAFETAAHALAAALRRDQAVARSRPTLRLVSDNPAPQSAPKRSKAQSASGPDLDAPVKAAPKKGAAVGAFNVVWADGTVTRVSAVTYHAGKPDTRWPLAYQLANRLRRRRLSRDLRADLEQTSRLIGADRILSGGIVTESEAWRAYLASVPLAPLSAIFCEESGEAFDAPDGSAFGAGDRLEADRLAQAMTAPRVLGERDPLLSPEALRQQAHDARVLWETPKANPPAAEPGEAIRPEGVTAGDRLCVDTALPGLGAIVAASVALEAASATVAATTLPAEPYRDRHELWEDFTARREAFRAENAEAITAWENAIAAENEARDALMAAEASAGLDETGRFLASLAGRVLTVRRVDFRAVSLADDQGGVILTHDALAFLRLAA